MTRADAVRGCLHRLLDITTDEFIARWLLSFARSPVNDSGEIYSCWCDDQGACKDKPWEGECPCSDEDHIACILRFLQGEYTPFETGDN